MIRTLLVALLALFPLVAHAQTEQQITPTFLAYGCNMCLRLATIREDNLRFDETLVGCEVEPLAEH